MSDNSAVADAMPVRRALHHCSGGPGCACASKSSSVARSPTVGSPSRSHSPMTQDTNSGASGDSKRTGSEDKSGLPDGVPENEWSGLGVVRVRKCKHGRHAVMKKCWGGKHTGRRFLACPTKEETDQCQFMEWLDKPWPERVQECLRDLWKELKLTGHCEATTNEALIDAIKVNEIATSAGVKLEAELNRTKRVAERVCSTYNRKAALAVIDKSKLMYLIYCLLGVIVFLVVAIFFKGN